LEYLDPATYAILGYVNALSRKPAAPVLVKTLWFGLISLLLGPFALWFLLDGKLRRRGLLPGYPARFLMSAALFLAFHVFLFIAPIHWSGLLALYLGACGFTTWAMSRESRSAFFTLPTNPIGQDKRSGTFPESLLTLSMAIFPLAFLLSLVRQIGELGDFSIRLPSDVFLRSFAGMAYAAPVVLLLAWGTWKASYRPGLRALVYFHAAVAVVLGWIMVWERLDQIMAALFDVGDRNPLFFSYASEIAWRSAVKWFFYGASFLLGVAYLVGAARTSAFFKRALVLCIPTLMLYANMLFVLGDWNLYLGAFRDGAYALHHYTAYRLAAQSSLLRTPDAYDAPALREEWADLEYQSGRIDMARNLLARLSEDGRRHPYHAILGRRADSSLARLARPHGEAVVLDLPVIQPASYLDKEWYALLGAVAFLKPEWTDLDLRKKLLDLSSTVQLHLPNLENLPELAPAFRQLEIPISPCFLTKERAVAALKAGKIPFLSLDGHWVPLSGYDPGRDGFYYYSYRDQRGGSGLFRNEDMDLFRHTEGERFGGRKGKAEPRYSLQRFIPADELMRHVVDIGGVAIILGDSAFVDPAERHAAFLVEQGDVHYQDHDNYEDAALCYRQAAALFKHDQILSRMLYLKRRYREAASDPRDYRNLFKEYPPRWMRDLALPAAEEHALMGRILAGGLGSYILLNWHTNPAPDTTPEARAALDTALRIFTTLHALDPDEPLYLDSLASLHRRTGDFQAAESLYVRLASLQPFSEEYALYQLAWVRFKRGSMDGMDDLLDRCDGYAEEARYLTMRGALEMARGREGKAFASLSRSLKLDKGLGETHALLAEFHKRRGDAQLEAVHRAWLKRST
jgi:tetratricopeptide (TPR) repeat protein